LIIRTFFGTSTYVLSEKRRDFFQKNDVLGEVKVFTKRGVFVKKITDLGLKEIGS